MPFIFILLQISMGLQSYSVKVLFKETSPSAPYSRQAHPNNHYKQRLVTTAAHHQHQLWKKFVGNYVSLRKRHGESKWHGNCKHNGYDGNTSSYCFYDNHHRNFLGSSCHHHQHDIIKKNKSSWYWKPIINNNSWRNLDLRFILDRVIHYWIKPWRTFGHHNNNHHHHHCPIMIVILYELLPSFTCTWNLRIAPMDWDVSHCTWCVPFMRYKIVRWPSSLRMTMAVANWYNGINRQNKEVFKLFQRTYKTFWEIRINNMEWPWWHSRQQ